MQEHSRNTSLLRREMLGALLICLAGSLLHFVFAWSGRWPPVALFAAVNESIWEHLKLAFWPGLFWAVLMRGKTHLPAGAYWAARGLALAVAPVTIVAIFISYTAILGRNLLFLDISTFFIAVFLGQAVAVALLRRGALAAPVRAAGLVLLAVQIGSFALFTYLPPDHSLFIEQRSFLRGMPQTGAHP